MAKTTNPFRIAKRYLWNGTMRQIDTNKTEYICHALRDACYYKKLDHNTCVEATRIVSNRLGGAHKSVGRWLRENYPEFRSLYTNENVQFYRRRWLDHLAKEWDKGIRE